METLNSTENANYVFDFSYDRQLFDMLPRYYQDYLESSDYLMSSDKEFKRLFDVISWLYRESSLMTSEDILGHYADLLGIEHEGGRLARWVDVNNRQWSEFAGKRWGDFIRLGGYSSERLREIILSTLNTHRTSSIKGLKEYIKDISGYDVEIVEFNQLYEVTVFLREGSGSEVLMDDIIGILEPLIPAHIKLSITHTYIRWVEWDSIEWSWEGIDNEKMTWKDIENREVWTQWLS